jgi:CRP/FNR family transcriptional regulator
MVPPGPIRGDIVEVRRRGAGSSTREATGLPPELAQELRVRPPKTLGVQGQACTQIYLIESGYVALRHTGRDGQDRVMDLLGPGDCFGEEALQLGRVWHSTAVVLTPGELQVIPGAQLVRYGQHYPKVLHTILGQLSTRIEREYRRMDLMQYSNAATRTYGLLHLLAARYGEAREGQLWLEMPLRQSELADLIGLRRETMSRVLARLSADGMIQRRGRRGIWVNPTYAHP